MISEKTAEQEARAAKAFRWLIAGYVLIGGMLSAVYAVAGNWYLAVQSMGTVAALAAIFGLLKLLRIRPVYSLYAAIVVFTFAAYTLGVACSLYKTLPGYDKILHMLSGTFTMMLVLPLFYVLKSGHQVEKKDCALAVAVLFLAVQLFHIHCSRGKWLAKKGRPLLLALALCDHGIDQLNIVLPIIHDCYTAENADLRRRQTHTVGIDEGFQHIVKKLSDSGGNFRNGTAHLS